MVQPGIIYESEEDDIQLTGKKMSFSVNKPIALTDDPSNFIDQPKKKKSKTPNVKTLSDGSKVVSGDDDLPETMKNTPYHESYTETNNMLKSVIMQSDIMTNEISKDLSDIRSSKTLKKKYDYISMLASTSSTLLGTKVTAIRELNKSITDSHNLDLKRAKELKLVNEQDDDKRIMDMYNAFISTPMGINAANFIPQSHEMNYVPSGSIDTSSSDAGYSNYLNNLTPQQNRMRYENDPNIKTVVKYYSETGARHFDVINMLTGESIDNIERPASMLLENITLDVRNGIARDTNLDVTYPLIVIGSHSLSEY